MRSPSLLLSATPWHQNRLARVGLLLAALTVAAVPALAVNRVVRISAPSSVGAGTQLNIPILASTDAGGGEQVGFFHAEYSTDSGKTWVGFCFEEKVGAKATRFIRLTAGMVGSKIMVRARIAFRGGTAGDVDYKGSPIDWSNAWEKWQEPPAKSSSISVVAR